MITKNKSRSSKKISSVEKTTKKKVLNPISRKPAFEQELKVCTKPPVSGC